MIEEDEAPGGGLSRGRRTRKRGDVDVRMTDQGARVPGKDAGDGKHGCCHRPPGTGAIASKSVLWMELCPPQSSYVGALTPNMTVFRDGAYKEAIKAK